MIDGNAQSQSLQSTALEAAVASIRSRPVALVSVIFPALRVILSFRLLRSVFRRENLRRFLLLPNLVTDGFCHGRLRV